MTDKLIVVMSSNLRNGLGEKKKKTKLQLLSQVRDKEEETENWDAVPGCALSWGKIPFLLTTAEKIPHFKHKLDSKLLKSVQPFFFCFADWIPDA